MHFTDHNEDTREKDWLQVQHLYPQVGNPFLLHTTKPLQ